MTHKMAVVAVLILIGGVSLARGHAAGLDLDAGKLTVDQRATSVPGATCTLSAPSEDAVVQEALPLINDGTSTFLRAKSQLLANERALVKFAIDSCNIPSGARVTAATLTLHLTEAPAVPRLYAVGRVNSSWAEGTVTWSGQPSIGLVPTGTFTSATGSVSVDVKNDVANIVNGTNNDHGWRVADTVESDALGARIVIAAREHADASKRPTLVIGYYP